VRQSVAPGAARSLVARSAATLIAGAAAAYSAQALALLASAAPVVVGATPLRYEVAPTYNGVQTHSLYVPSFDGTRLAVTVHRPTRDGVVAGERLPVIVQQGNDDPAAGSAATIRYFTERGYIWVSQSRRGTGASFGVQTGFVNDLDAQDAKATIEWAGAQPFSTAKVVTFGCSNQGAWQFMAMKHKPKYMVAASAQCASAAFFDHGISLNGINYMALADKPYSGQCALRSGALRPARPVATKPVDEDMDGSLLKAAITEQKCGAEFLGQYWLNMPRDGYNAYAKNRPGIADSAMMSAADVKQSGVALLQIGGWFDTGVAGQFEGQRLWGGRVYMVPRTHGNRDIKWPNDVLDVEAESLRWFDHYAKGVDNGADRPAAIYYTMNAPAGAEWRQAASWPPADVAGEVYYLSGGSLTRKPPAARARPVAYAQQDVKWFDGTYGASRRSWDGDMAGADAKSLVHTIAPLTRDTEVTGTPVARLWASADRADINVFAVLEDVLPNGRSRYVTDGRLRASWRKLQTPPWGKSTITWHRGYAADIVPLVPGKAEELVFDFFPTSYVFKKGHRVRVSIITSAGEKYQAPPLAGGQDATLTLYEDRSRPSSITLPIMQAKD
jgi:putative CocE/NonD family hydrolase